MANLVNADLDAISVVKKSWKHHIRDAMNVNGGDTDDASLIDYIMHVVSFPWKVSFSFLPPPNYFGGWLCFFTSLTVIGILTAIVGDAAAIFGCLVGVQDSVTAIT
jgi:solute carrier family 8 (sodium/calcium exchanger)